MPDILLANNGEEYMQQSVAIIHRELRTESGVILVDQRRDGYVDLTQLCQGSGKLFGNWRQTQDTQDYLDELASTIGIPIVELVQVITDAGNGQRHTWGHPRVALKCAAWCNKKFEVQVYEWIEELRTTGVVDLRQKGTALQNALDAIGLAIKEDRQDINVLQKDMVQVKSEVAHVKTNVIRIEQAYTTAQRRRLRAAQRYHAEHTLSDMREKAYRWAGGRCLNTRCRRALWLHDDEAPTPDDLMQLDHVAAVHQGANLTWDNIQPLCGPCHRRKTLAQRQGQCLDYRPGNSAFTAACARQQQQDDLQQLAREERHVLPLFDGCCLPLRPRA